MTNKQSSWFSDIVDPAVSALQANSSYIDSLIGSKKSRTHVAQPRRCDQHRSQILKNQTVCPVPRKYPSTKTKSSVVDLDDTKWIEERRKKFPRLNGDEEVPRQCKVDCSIEAANSNTPTSSVASMGKDRVHSASRVSERRKKSLFEKLME